MKQRLDEMPVRSNKLRPRVYVLLDVADGKAGQVAQTLLSHPNIVAAAVLEGPPDIMMVMEAPERLKLARMTVEAFASVEAYTTGMHILPARKTAPRGTGIVTSPVKKEPAAVPAIK